MHETFVKSYENYVEKQEQQQDLSNEEANKARKEEVNDYLSENYFKWRAKYYEH